MDLNNEILASAGSAWDDWRPFDADWYTSSVAHEFRKRACEVLSEEFGDDRRFVLKDPRMCRLSSFWIEAIGMYGAEPLIVSPIRSPLDVSASLEARDGIDPSIGSLLWLRHVLDAEKATRGLKRAWLRYDMLFFEPHAVMDALGETLAISWLRTDSANLQLEINQFINRDLRHHQSNDARLSRDPKLSCWIKSSFDILDRWTREGAHDEDVEKLDEIRSAFDEATPAFSHALAVNRRTIEALHRVVKDRDDRIRERDDRIKERDDRIRERDDRIEALYGSRSWRMTAPFRGLRRMQRALTRKTRIAISLAAHTFYRPASLPTIIETRFKRRRFDSVPSLFRYMRTHENRAPLEDTTNSDAPRRPVDVIIPVYGGFEHTRRCLKSVLASVREGNINVVVIDDSSPDAKIKEYVEHLSKCGLITLLTNRENMGFVQTVNHGMQLNVEHDVILLNSDTEVAGDWVARLRKCAYRDSSIGTVTPFSNNAETCSFPRLCRVNDLPGEFGITEIDAVFSQLDEYEPVDIPSAVGFCMYIKRNCLMETGYFDAGTFGKGYGEENDFCMRALRNGWRNVLCPYVFVFHEGGVSFGSEKKERMDRAMAVMDDLYPHYRAMVTEHIQLNPAKIIRLHAMLNLLRSSGNPRILHITHNLGGGTHKHVVELAESLSFMILSIKAMPDYDENIVLFLNGEDRDMAVTFSSKETESLSRFLRFIGISSVHIHQIYNIPIWFVDLVKSFELPYDLTLHDYYYINANPTLTDEEGVFTCDETTRDALCNIPYPIPGDVPSWTWRKNQQTLLENAQRVFVPSAYVKDIFYKYFPDVNYVLACHPENKTEGIYPDVFIPEVESGERIRIMVLGALSKEKGADVLEHVAIGSSIECEFHLVGCSYRPIDSMVVDHGPYMEDQLDGIIERIDPHVIWFPAKWPETYSYTLSEAMRNGRAVIVPDIGAFPERVRDRPFTWIEPWNKPLDEWVRYFNGLRSVLQDESGRSSSWMKQPKFDFEYSEDYMKSAAFSRPPPLSCGPLDKRWLRDNGNRYSRMSWKQNAKEKLFLVLARSYIGAHNRKLSRRIVMMIPYRIKRLVKSWLTDKPVNEFVKRVT